MHYSQAAVRMKDVADAAGVPRVTVSRVLNKNGGVGYEKQQAVLAAAERLGYLRNHNASMLATGRAELVGAIVSDISDVRIARIIGLLSDAMLESGFPLLVAQSHGQNVRQKQLVDIFLERRVSAIVLLGSEQSDIRNNFVDGRYSPTIGYWELDEDPEIRIKMLINKIANPRGVEIDG